MREGRGSSVCCLVQPYSTSGFKKGYYGQNCAVIFAAGSSPQLFPGEEPSEIGQFPVIIEKPSVAIDPTLRLDFSNVYTIEHNATVRNVGRIDRNYLKELKSAFLKAMGAKAPEMDYRQARFESSYTVENLARVSRGSNYDSAMIDRIPSPAPSFEEDLRVTASSKTENLHRGMDPLGKKVRYANDFQITKYIQQRSLDSEE
jgi:hypothetical protein